MVDNWFPIGTLVVRRVRLVNTDDIIQGQNKLSTIVPFVEMAGSPGWVRLERSFYTFQTSKPKSELIDDD